MSRRYRLNPPSASRNQHGGTGSNTSLNLKVPTRFLAEVQIVISFLLITACMFTMIFYPRNEDENGDRKNLNGHYDYRTALMFFLSVTIVSNFLDVGLACLLIYATKKTSEELTLIWWRGTLSALILHSFQTIAFSVGLSTILVFLSILPGLIFKPFALWVVNAFIANLSRAEARTAAAIAASKSKYYTSSYLDDSLDFIEDEIDGFGRSPGPSASGPSTLVIVENGNENDDDAEEFELRHSTNANISIANKPSGDCFGFPSGRAPLAETDEV